MPQHAYHTDRRPPRVIDHIFAHCFELALATWAMGGGVASVYASASERATVSPSLDQLAPWVSALVGVLLLIGGLGMWIGLLDDSDDLMTGWRIERGGLIFSGAGWACFGVAIFGASRPSVLTWTLALIAVLAHIVRFIATILEERRTREAIQ